MRLRERVFELREPIRAAAAAHGAQDVRLFGSAARGEDTDASDIDFLVSLERGRTLLDLARLEIQLEKLLGCTVDVVTESGLREPLRTSALQEATPV